MPLEGVGNIIASKPDGHKLMGGYQAGIVIKQELFGFLGFYRSFHQAKPLRFL